MKIEVFTLCDAATDNQGKLNILGTFDQIFAKQAPIFHPACSIALRIRFNKMEEGRHKVMIRVVDADGSPVFKQMEGELQPRMGPDIDSLAVNMILNFQHLKFSKFDDYQMNLFIDGNSVASLPLRLRQIVPHHPA